MNFVLVLFGFVAISQASVLTPGLLIWIIQMQNVLFTEKMFLDFDYGAVYGKRTWPYGDKKWYRNAHPNS